MSATDASSPDFECRVKAQDPEGDRYLIDVGFGYTRILDTEYHRLFGPMRGQEMKFAWERFTGDEANILAQARTAIRLERNPPEGDVDPALLNSRP